MRYLAIRQRIIKILSVGLLVAVFVLVVPWIFRSLFTYREDFIMENLDFHSKDFLNFLDDVKLNKNISLDVSFLNDGYVSSKWTIREAGFKNMVVSADVFVKGCFVKDEEGKVKAFSGKLFTSNLRLNPDASMPASMSFSITKDGLKIEALRLARSYTLRGTVALSEPFKTDLVLDIERADIKDVSLVTRIKNREALLGTMNGVVYIKGHLANLFSNGIIQSRNGKVGPIAYQVATIKLEGFGPVINIADANVSQANGRLAIEGYIDLRNIGKGILFDGLKVKSEIGTIAWDGWDIAKRGKDELTMSKDVSDSMRVGFKTMAEDTFTTYYEKENPEEMSLEYKMGLENLKMKLRENEEFLVIEHNIKF